MNKTLNILKINSLWKIFALAACAVMLIGLTGCTGSYGRVTRDPELTKAIANNTVIEGFKYYYYGYASKPYAVAGIDPKYEVRSKLWREIDPKTENEKFQKMIYWIWQDYGYYPYGAHILDPSDNKVGILYSSVRHISVKFTEDNRIVLMPDKPSLQGPGGEGGSAFFGG
jgi:hypothetical protein